MSITQPIYFQDRPCFTNCTFYSTTNPIMADCPGMPDPGISSVARTEDTPNSPCPICPESSFPNEKGLYEHCREHHPKMIVDRPMPSTNTCPHKTCTELCKSPDELYDHYYSRADHPVWTLSRRHGTPAPSCVFSHCKQTYRSEELMKLHYLMNHRTIASINGLTPSASHRPTDRWSSSGYMPRDMEAKSGNQNNPIEIDEDPVTAHEMSHKRSKPPTVHVPGSAQRRSKPQTIHFPRSKKMEISHILTDDREVPVSGRHKSCDPKRIATDHDENPPMDLKVGVSSNSEEPARRLFAGSREDPK